MNLAVNQALTFADSKGRPSKRVEKRVGKLLAKASPILGQVMEEDEQIEGVITACSPFSFLEFLTTGYIITAIKRCMLVVTDRRILHLPTKGNFTPRGSVSEVRFADIDSGSVAGFLGKKLNLVYRGGNKESFSGLSGAGVKRIGTWVKERAGVGEPTARGGRNFICPSCASVLARDADSCGQCSFEFRSRKKALRYSLLFPGGGYFYTGHPLMGVLDGLVEGFLLLVIVSGVGLAMAGEPDMWASVGLMAGVLGFEKLITIYHANHYVSEFLPARASSPSSSSSMRPR